MKLLMTDWDEEARGFLACLVPLLIARQSMMALPSRILGHQLVADGTETVLLLPEIDRAIVFL